MDELKLYVWEEYHCDFTCGIAFAIAESPEEARQMIIEKSDMPDKEVLADKPQEFDQKVAFDIVGGG